MVLYNLYRTCLNYVPKGLTYKLRNESLSNIEMEYLYHMFDNAGLVLNFHDMDTENVDDNAWNKSVGKS